MPRTLRSKVFSAGRMATRAHRRSYRKPGPNTIKPISYMKHPLSVAKTMRGVLGY